MRGSSSRRCDSHAARPGIRARITQHASLTLAGMVCWALNLPEHVRKYCLVHSWPRVEGFEGRRGVWGLVTRLVHL